MIEAEKCPACGARIPAGSPEDAVCPACMLERGIAMDESKAGGTEDSSAGNQPETPNDPTSAGALNSQVLRFSPFPGATPFEPPSVEELNSQISDFEILELRGRGGMGAVYRARHRSLNRPAAIKVLPPILAEKPEVKERFHREARALAQLNHPNIVTIYEIGQAGDHLFFAMEYIEGKNLTELIGTDELTGPAALRIFSEICDALGFAHDQGIVHRDIKPDNILIDEKGRANVADFGLAKLMMAEGPGPDLDLTMSQQALGTLAYMAPEQRIEPLRVDQRCDIYALGVVFYEMLTGEVPAGHFQPPSALVPVDPRLDAVVLRMLSTRPSDRYASVHEIVEALNDIAANQTGPETLSSNTRTRFTRPVSGPRQVTVFFSDIVGFSSLNEKLGDRDAWNIINDLLELQSEIIERENRGQVKKVTGDSVMAVFDAPSTAMITSLEIQRHLKELNEARPDEVPGVRIGLHVGEILLEEEDHVEIVSRHINRAHRVMEMAGDGQILASKAVVDAGADFIETVPDEFLNIAYYGEFYLKGVGAIELCEVTDLRVRESGGLETAPADRENQSIRGRLELAGYSDAERIGEGSFGVVYKATESQTGETVAVKVLPPFASYDRETVEKIGTEAGELGELGGQGITGIRKSLLDHHPPCIVMDYVDGRSIVEALQSESAADIAGVFYSVCQALYKAHRRDFVHRDLKPSNILVDSKLQPHIVDFGLGTLIESGSGNGSQATALSRTAEYLAPEQIRGHPADPRTDIYSLGAILYQVLSGAAPYSGETVYAILDGHLYQDPVIPAKDNPRIDEGLQRICLKALEKRPDQRYQSVKDMGEDLSRVIRGERVRTRPTAYDNLLYNRAAKHIEEINHWKDDGLLSIEEKHTIQASYDGLLKRGVAAVMESRGLRPALVSVYVGGWLAVSAAILWATFYWNDLNSLQRIAIGSAPALFTGLVAWAMHRFEHYRLLFVTMVVFLMAVPLFGYAWIHEFSIGANPNPEAHDETVEVFSWAGGDKSPIANRQLLLIGLISLMAAATVAWFSQATTHAAQVAIFALLFYICLLLCAGLKHWLMDDRIAKAMLAFLPLIGLSVLTGHVLGKTRDRARQLIPWVHLAAILSLAFCLFFPGNAIREWFEFDYNHSESLAAMATSFFGIVAMLFSFWLRSHFSYRAGISTLLVILFGAATVWWYLLAAIDPWPEDWSWLTIFDRKLPLPAIMLPFASLAVIMAGCWRQLMTLLLLGLFELNISLFVLANLYFQGTQNWPAFIMIIGSLWFSISLYFEWRISKGNTANDSTSRTRL